MFQHSGIHPVEHRLENLKCNPSAHWASQHKEKEMNTKFNIIITPKTPPILIAVAVGYAVSKAWSWLRS
jgi:hypothetical protein